VFPFDFIRVSCGRLHERRKKGDTTYWLFDNKEIAAIREVIEKDKGLIKYKKRHKKELKEKEKEIKIEHFIEEKFKHFIKSLELLCQKVKVNQMFKSKLLKLILMDRTEKTILHDPKENTKRILEICTETLEYLEKIKNGEMVFNAFDKNMEAIGQSLMGSGGGNTAGAL
jgi:hypothetical protein